MHTENTQTNNVLLLLTTFLYVSFFLPMGSAIPTLLILGYYLLKVRLNVRFTRSFFLVYILLFVAYCYLSTLWATDIGYVLIQANHLIKTAFGLLVLYIVFQDQEMNEIILKSIMWGGYILIAFVVATYGISDIRQMILLSERMSNDIMNANQLAMCISYSCIIHLYYGFVKKWSISHLLLIPAFMFIPVAQSRKGLLIIAIGVVGVILINNYKKRTPFVGTIKTFIYVIAVLIVGFYLLQLPVFSGLSERVNNLIGFISKNSTSDTSLLARRGLIEIGFDLFKSRPFVGVGIDNARLYTESFYGAQAYLHNNYMEMLAGGGIIGFLIYYSMYFYLIVKLFKYKIKENESRWFCLLFLIILMVMHFAHVSYKSSGEYFYLLFIYLEAKKFEKVCKQKRAVTN